MSSDFKKIGPRIEFSKDKESLLVIISQGIETWKKIALGVWLILWIACAAGYLSAVDIDDNKIFVALFMLFWGYVFFKVFKVFVWRLVGKEIIEINDGAFAIKHAFGRFGRPQIFDLERVKNFGLIKRDDTKMAHFFESAFWMMGGETIGFTYNGKKMVLGKQLDEKSIPILGRLLDKTIQEHLKVIHKKNRNASS